jgi:hypothetical protein
LWTFGIFPRFGTLYHEKSGNHVTLAFFSCYISEYILSLFCANYQ